MRFVKILKNIFNITAVALFAFACSPEKHTTVKDFLPGKPFVYENKITLNGNLSKDEKKRLLTELNNYWDDSLQVRRLQKLGIFYILKNPPVFDSANIYRSQKYMNAYLNSQGYYYAQFPFAQVKFDTLTVKASKGFFNGSIEEQQIRTTVSLTINAGKNVTVDSVGYAMLDSNLQKMALHSIPVSEIKKDNPYSKQVISSELDRLTVLYRDSGYYNIHREDFFAEVDSINHKLLKLTFSPLEQAKLLNEAAKNKKTNPRWDVVFKQKEFEDSSKVQQYHVSKIWFYPEAKLTDIPDSLIKHNHFNKTVRKDLILMDSVGKFRLRPMRDNSFLRRDSLYNESLYYKTINNLSRIGAWQQVDARIVPNAKDSLDIHVFLVPAIKQSFEVTLEGSRNTGDITIGNTLGLATNFTYRNKNVWKQAIQSATSLRLGTELNIGGTGNTSNDVLQTVQASLLQNYSFPRLILPKNSWKFLRKWDNKHTTLSGGAAYTDRRDIFRIRSLTAGFGYDWTTNNGSWGFSFKPANIELYGIDTLAGFKDYIINNPFQRNSFRDGSVIGIMASATKTFQSKHNPKISHFFRASFEESGTLLSIFTTLKDRLFTYDKLELEYRFNKKNPKTAWAGRVNMGGIFPRSGQSSPVYKQFSLGGPNSMRAWGLRQLGLGSSILNDTSTSQYTERFGDLALEANIEYRFPIFTTGSFKIASAFFADAGNIWAIKADAANPNSEINIARFGKDLALGIGTGLRLDFNYFLIRIDAGYKVKDPARQYNNGWMRDFSFTEKRSNGVELRNYAIQLGINLPF